MPSYSRQPGLLWTDSKLTLPLKNPYKSLIARAIELVNFYEEAIQLVNKYLPEGPSRLRSHPQGWRRLWDE